MDEQYIVDTNVIIYYLNNDIPDEHLERIEHIFRTSFHISTITKIELLGWQALDETGEQKMRSFLTPAKVIYINEAIEEQAIKIKQLRKTKAPDAIIGATTVVHKMTIVTRNESDFERIEGIKIYNPFK